MTRAKSFLIPLIAVFLTAALAITSSPVLASLKITLIIDGQKAEPDVPPMVINNRTLVPVRFIAEHLGAQVGWHQETRTVTISRPGQEIVLKLNSRRVTVNGQTREIDVPAIAVDNRTLVPLRFVSETFGSRVEWMPTPPTVAITTPGSVTAVTVDPSQGGQVTIATTRPTDYRVMTLTDPNRLVIDFSGLANQLPAELKLASDTILSVRTSTFSGDPLITRVVFDLAGPPQFDIVKRPDGQGIVVRIATVGAPANPAPTPDPGQPQPGLNPILQGRRIAIDPGHGGHDPGARGALGLIEKDLNLDIALRVRELLAAGGAQVILTRDGDYYVNLYERARIANEAEVELFVSIHTNATWSRLVNQTETYHFKTTTSRAFAEVMQAALVAELDLPDRGVIRQDFVVIRETMMPSILVEPAYLSNPDQERLFADEAYRQRVARAIVRGLEQFLAQLGD
ncbi:MAG: N-acetylmuramoyl-L-alanine amidase family protein [Bacillota bacterium]